MSEHHEEVHELNYKEPIAIFCILLLYTAVTVLIGGGFESPTGSLLIAMALASVKATLVVRYFMHLKYESPVFTIFLGISIATFVLIFTLLFADYGFRW